MMIRKRKIQIAALPSQERFFASTTFAKGFSGPVGSGKTYALCIEALQCTARNPGCVGLIGAPTYTRLRDVTLTTMLDILEDKRIPYSYLKQENVLTLHRRKSRILFRSLERFEHLRGPNLAWVGVDELTYCQADAWKRLEARVRDPKAFRHQMFAVWTPKGHYWVYKRFISAKEKLPRHEAILATPGENFVVLAKRRLLRAVEDLLRRTSTSRRRSVNISMSTPAASTMPFRKPTKTRISDMKLVCVGLWILTSIR